MIWITTITTIIFACHIKPGTANHGVVTEADVIQYLDAVGSDFVKNREANGQWHYLFSVITDQRGWDINDPRVKELVGIVCAQYPINRSYKMGIACTLFKEIAESFLSGFLPALQRHQNPAIRHRHSGLSSIPVELQQGLVVTYDQMKAMFPIVCGTALSTALNDSCACLRSIGAKYMSQYQQLAATNQYTSTSQRPSLKNPSVPSRYAETCNRASQIAQYGDVKDMLPFTCQAEARDHDVFRHIYTVCHHYKGSAENILQTTVTDPHLEVLVPPSSSFLAQLCKRNFENRYKTMCEFIFKHRMDLLLREEVQEY